MPTRSGTFGIETTAAEIAGGIAERAKDHMIAEDAPDTALIAAARRGDRASFASLHDRYAPMVHGLLLARVPCHEAEDLTQETFLRAMRSLGSLRSLDALGPWLAAIARNLAARYHRRQRFRATIGLRDDHEATPNPGPISPEAAQALAAIRSLPEAYRETLIMRLVEGMTGPEIASRTGLTHGSVRVNLHRGMAMLRARLGTHEENRP